MDGKTMDSAARVTRPESGHASRQLDLLEGAVEQLGSGTQGEIPSVLKLQLEVHDADTIAELVQQESAGLQNEYALKALRIGVLALRQARGAVDADAVRRESDRLLISLQERLNQHSELVNDRVNNILQMYFDPKSGHFHERLDRLIKRDGELEELLRRQIGQEDSELRKTLSSHIGEDSHIMKMLSPDESRGVLAALRETLEQQLKVQRDHVLNQFSLDNREGALSRFIGELTDRQGKLSEKLEGRLDEVVKEFSLDEDDSALSRLVRNVERAQKTITSEFSLDEETSALSRLKQLLEKTNTTIHQQLSLDDDSSPLARLKREMFKLLQEQNETARNFQEEVRVVLETMKARKEEADKSTRHGLTFEDAVFAFTQNEASKLGDVAEATGNSTGLIKNSKVGDCVVTLGPESAAPDVKVVVEAKEDQSYNLTKARLEIEVARKNRGAQVGIFVFSSRTVPEGIDLLTRYGHDIVVVWNPEEPATDLYFKAAISLARALCVRDARRNDSTTADFEAIDKAILEIEKRAGGLEDIEKWIKTIQSNADKILKKVETGRRSFDRQVEILRERTADLKQMLGDGNGE